MTYRRWVEKRSICPMEFRYSGLPKSAAVNAHGKNIGAE